MSGGTTYPTSITGGFRLGNWQTRPIRGSVTVGSHSNDLRVALFAIVLLLVIAGGIYLRRRQFANPSQ
jgi:hypothetical protein